MLISTPAIILRVFPYGETSRVVRLATRDVGVQSVIAKGATRPRSPFGGRLQILSEGVAQFYHRAHRDLHTLRGFDVTDQHATLAADLRRFAGAAALAELVLRCAQEEPQPRVYETLADGMRALATSASDAVPYVALARLWHAIAVLGFAPTVTACVRCEKALGERASFAVADGGLLCPDCGRGTGAGGLGPDDQAALRAFLTGSAEVPTLPNLHLVAHRRLLVRFVLRHAAEERELPALDFWERMA
jgi:DNA repair protein RecO (recombination protein O)